MDIAVVGLGAMGAATCWALARRGVATVGLDRWSPPHPHGSSHGGSRIIRQAYFEGGGYVPLILRAYELWAALGREAGGRLLEPTGGLLIGPPGSEVVEGAQRSAVAHDLTHELLGGREVMRRWPAITPDPGDVALFEPEAGVLSPERCVTALLRAAAARGAELRTGVAVTGWEASPGGGVTLFTSEGRLTVDRVVFAAGPWSAALVGGLPLTVERQVVAWFRPRQAEMPLFVRDRADAPKLYGIPDLDGSGVKVAFHHGGMTGDPELLPRTVGDEELTALAGAARDLLPALGDDVVAAATCLYTNSPDRHFVVGAHPTTPAAIVLAGFSGHGFKFAPVVGELAADLATTGATTSDLSLFAPGRWREPS